MSKLITKNQLIKEAKKNKKPVQMPKNDFYSSFFGIHGNPQQMGDYIRSKRKRR